MFLNLSGFKGLALPTGASLTRCGRSGNRCRATGIVGGERVHGPAMPNSENIVSGVFTPVLAKHSKSFSLIDCVSVGVDRMQRNFEPMRKQVEARQRSELTDVTARVVIYEAFVEGKLEAPKHLARTVHDLYFEPKYEEFLQDDLESFERVHVCDQGIGADSPIQGNSETGRIPGD